MGFTKKKLLGGYDDEADHYYYLSNIVNVKGYSNGFDVEVYFEATDDRSAEVVTYFYEVKNDTDRWLEALSKRKSEPKPEQSAPQQQVTREVIKEKETVREIVKIRCSHCRRTFDEVGDFCPYCGAPS